MIEKKKEKEHEEIIMKIIIYKKIEEKMKKIKNIR